MDSLELIKVFTEVVQRGGFARAATKLSLSKATVSKYVAELESRLGVRLLNRTSRAISLTAAGALMLERGKLMLEMFEHAQVELQALATQPMGRLKIAAPAGAGHGDLPSLLGQFMTHYPEVSITLLFTNDEIDMAGDAIDLMFRHGPIEDENLIVKRIRRRSQIVCASPDYWRKHGKPLRPEDLAQHHALTHSKLGSAPKWIFDVDGQALEVPLRSRLDSTETAPLIELALQGLGVIYVPETVVQPHIQSGALEPALESSVRNDMWVSIAYLQRRHNSAALRALVDFLVKRLAQKS